MIRKTLTILSLIGLLLSVGLWGVSYFNLIYVIRNQGQSNTEGVEIYLAVGMIGWTNAERWREAKGPNVYFGEVGFHTLGYDDLRTLWAPVIATTSAGSVAAIAVPLWIPGAVFGLTFLSCRPLHFHRRRKRKKLGLCLKCGYDLRASKERCPECGTFVNCDDCSNQ